MSICKRGLVLAAFFISAGAWGASVPWVLQDVVFSSGATATGVIVYDTTFDVITTVSININGWSPTSAPGENYGPQNVDPFNYSLADEVVTSISSGLLISNNDDGGGLAQCAAPDGCYRRILLQFLSLDSVQAAEDGVAPISIGSEVIKSSEAYDLHNVISGNLIATVVPIPAAGWLFVSALTGLGWMRRKQAT